MAPYRHPVLPHPVQGTHVSKAPVRPIARAYGCLSCVPGFHSGCLHSPCSAGLRCKVPISCQTLRKNAKNGTRKSSVHWTGAFFIPLPSNSLQFPPLLSPSLHFSSIPSTSLQFPPLPSNSLPPIPSNSLHFPPLLSTSFQFPPSDSLQFPPNTFTSLHFPPIPSL